MWNIGAFLVLSAGAPDFIQARENGNEEASEVLPPVPSAPPESFFLPVSSSSAEAGRYTLQGLHHLICSWDEAAFRSFSKALEYDPDCFMANWGVVFSSFGSDHLKELDEALRKIRSLARKKELPALEESYCNILALLIGEGREAASLALEEHSELFRRDTFSLLLRILLLRDGYTLLNTPLPGQRKAIELSDALLERFPAMHAALFQRALLEECSPEASGRSFECAVQAANLAPEYAPAVHLRGILQFRRARYSEAASSFARAASLTRQTAKAQSIADDDLHISALLYLSASQWMDGDKKASLRTRNLLRSFPIDWTRPYARGTRLQIWEVRSLPARTALAGDSIPDSGDIRACMKAFSPPPPSIENDPTAAYSRTLRCCMEARRLSRMEKEHGLQFLREAEQNFKVLKAEKNLPGNRTWLSQIKRAEEAARVILLKTRALYADSPEQWRKDAEETQKLSSNFLPPAVL